MPDKGGGLCTRYAGREPFGLIDRVYRDAENVELRNRVKKEGIED